MKKLLVFLALSAFALSAHSQIVNPVTWSYAAKRTSKTEATVFLKATIDNGWHIYSQFMKEGGPIVTSFKYAAAKDFTLVGKTVEPKAITKYEDTFKMNVSYFEKTAVFQQKVKLKGAGAVVKGTLTYMTCNDKQYQPPEEVNFSIAVK